MELKGEWALILGASSGFGGATAKYLAEHGVNIIGVHLDRRATLPQAREVIKYIRSRECKSVFFNKNAADDRARKEILDKVEEILKKEGKYIKIILHSLAFGSLRYFVSDKEDVIDKKSMDMTLEVMGNSLLWWVQDLFKRKLIGKGTKIYAMTSAGGRRVWHYYGPVSAAKALLESIVRQLALELAPYGITVNALQAGVTDTPSLRKIPNYEKMLKHTKSINPSKRLTTPSDIAKAIYVLSQPGTEWITGNVIRVDGGEDLTG